MRTFTFQPQLYTKHRDLDIYGGEDAVAERAADATAMVLKKCHRSLERLICEGPMLWPGDEIIELPALRELVLDEDLIQRRKFTSWMSKMTSHENLELSYLEPRDGSSLADWGCVLDAIRDRPKRMRLYFFNRTGVGPTFLSYHTDDFKRHLEREEALLQEARLQLVSEFVIG
ncbi:MAG: hypothetical protein Q9181_008365 [Wetmoreana brouardii]